MKMKVSFAILLGLALGAGVYAQDQSPGPPSGQNGSFGRRGGGRGFGGMGMMGRGIAGNVTEAAADHFTVKTFEGDTYTVDYSANTRIVKMQAGMGGRGRMGGGGGMVMGGGRGMGGNPPEPIKASEIKVGDAIAARGEVNSSAKTVDAVAIMLLNPQMAQRMQQMAADYGKTWLMGRVTAIEGTKLTLMGAQDSAAHSFVVNENTEFRERRNPITLADLKVGDMVRVLGALSDSTFTASEVMVMGMPQAGSNGPGGAGGPGGAPNQ